MFEGFDPTTLITDLSKGAINFLVALLILLVFYIAARIISGIVRRALRSTDIDNRFAETMGGASFGIENAVATAVKWLIILFGLIAFFRRLDLPGVTGPLETLLDNVFDYLPRLGGALLLAGLAWVVATVVKTVVVRGSEALNLEARLNEFDAEGAPKTSISQSLGTGLFWLIILMFLPAILARLGMESLVAPLQDMLSEFLGFLPNILGAAIIFIIGMFVARIVRQVVTSLLSAVGLDGFGERAGLNMSLTTIVGTLVYTVIMLLVIVQSLDALGIDSISAPATSMIDLIFGSIPNIFGAALVLGISYVVGKLIAGLVSGLLGGVGFDSVPERVGLSYNSQRSPSEFVGWAVLVGVMLLATLAATDMLGFEPLSDIVSTFIGFAGQLVLGLIVLAIGFYLANMARDLALNAGVSAFVASLVRAAVLVLVGAMALERIGIGANIVELAFGIALGAIGIAAALAFGLGSREIAGREMERFVTNVRSQDEELS